MPGSSGLGSKNSMNWWLGWERRAASPAGRRHHDASCNALKMVRQEKLHPAVDFRRWLQKYQASRTGHASCDQRETAPNSRRNPPNSSLSRIGYRTPGSVFGNFHSKNVETLQPHAGIFRFQKCPRESVKRRIFCEPLRSLVNVALGAL